MDRILYCDENISEVIVEVEGNLYKAINYNRLTGHIKIGDSVSVNTNAINLKLGTGGFHFIIENHEIQSTEYLNLNGHIIKLRYTPIQIKCLAVEECDSVYHEIFKSSDSISGLPVIIGELHSMLYPLVHLLKNFSQDINIVYIMSDSACIPIWHSKAVRQLKDEELLKGTITYGQSFGGDCEAINLYTALIAAKQIYECDVAIVIPGPGVVGTDTKLGFSGIEQGHIIDAVNTLKGYPIFIPRISFLDLRERHLGISHHTLTVLGKITYSSAHVGIPIFEDDRKNNIIKNQIINNYIDKRHIVEYNKHYCKNEILSIVDRGKFKVTTMGRDISSDPDFFSAIGIAVKLYITQKLRGY